MTLPSRPAQQGSQLLSLFKRWEAQLVLLLIAAGLINTALSSHFLNTKNLFDMTFSFMEKSIIALPMAFIIITGNIDLSVASNLGMSAVVMASSFEAGLNIWLAVLLGLAVGTLGGLLNGLLVAKVKLPALVVTLGTYALYRGIAYSILGDLTVKGFPTQFTYVGQGYIPGTPMPFSLVLFFVLAVIFGLILHRTTLGRFVYAIGQNQEACRFSGVQVDRIKILLFTASGFMSALAGVVLAARFGSTRPDIGLGLELDVITSVVLGGVEIFGGAGSMVGVVLALFLLGVVRFGMSLINIRGQVQAIVVGSLLILAILVPQVTRQLQTQSATRRREAETATWRRLLYALVGVIGIALVVTLVNFLWLRPAGGGLGLGAPGGAGGTPGASGVSSEGPSTAQASPTLVVLKPTNTPKPPPPTPTPRPTSTSTATREATATPVTQETPSELPSETPTPTAVPRPDVPTIEIPGGPFTLGSDKFEPNEAPPQTMELPTFFIDQFETTNAEFAQFVAATSYETLVEKSGAKKNWRTYAEGKDNHPVVKVSYSDAEAYCEWMGKRLPTEFEWEKAARGSEGFVYPWGDSMDSTRVNGKASGLRGTTSVGSFSSGASPYGVEDMAGNVWEWTSSPFVAYAGSTYADPFYSPELRVTRGGGWFDDPRQLRGANRSAAPIEAANDDLGFRCAADSR